jgi:cysteine-rich repeat protein
VVHFDNYGMPLGQIRGNLLMMQPWLLREWRTDNPAAPGVAIETVKDNPLVEYYENAGTNGFDATRTADFQAEFGAVTFGNLFGVDQMVPDPLALSAFDVVSCFGAGFSDAFNEFQGIAQGITDNPRFHDQSDVQAVINGELTDTGLDAQGFSLDHTLNRAGAMTCGGCHQFAANQPIAPGPDGIAGNGDDLRWPFSGGFVHIDESGSLSPALTQMFLPARQGVLQDYLCDGCGATDTDGDQVRDNCDNCVDVPNADQADADGDAIGDACDPQTCGNAVLEAGEACDDGNVIDGDGCAADCTIEPVCGNGVLEGDEACDDGNVADGDGCAADCTLEVEPPAECCGSDADCDYLESCVMADGADFGVCVPGATGDDCWTDADCGAYGECAGAVLCDCEDADCAPAAGSCSGDDGDDDPEPALCSVDGSSLTCGAAAPACAADEEPAVRNGCFTGACIDAGQCGCHQDCHHEALVMHKTCVKKGHDPRKCARFAAQLEAECAEGCIAPEPVEPPAAPPANSDEDAAQSRQAVQEKSVERAAVDAARTQLEQARDTAGKRQAEQALKAAIDHARRVERAKPGLRGVRRAH